MTAHDPNCLVTRYPVIDPWDTFPWCTCHRIPKPDPPTNLKEI